MSKIFTFTRYRKRVQKMWRCEFMRQAGYRDDATALKNVNACRSLFNSCHSLYNYFVLGQTSPTTWVMWFLNWWLSADVVFTQRESTLLNWQIAKVWKSIPFRISVKISEYVHCIIRENKCQTFATCKIKGRCRF